MSYVDKAKIIGKAAFIKLSGIQVNVNVIDYKNSYGKDRWLVEPLSGKGTMWVEEVHTIKGK